jgi:hypothetical protein
VGDTASEAAQALTWSYSRYDGEDHEKGPKRFAACTHDDTLPRNNVGGQCWTRIVSYSSLQGCRGCLCRGHLLVWLLTSNVAKGLYSSAQIGKEAAALLLVLKLDVALSCNPGDDTQCCIGEGAPTGLAKIALKSEEGKLRIFEHSWRS